MLPLAKPVLNGIVLEHAELRALHAEMRQAIRDATSRDTLTGPRLLFPELGERYVLKAHRRDRDGNLLASVSVYTSASPKPFIRKVRLINRRKLIRGL
jgi:hypothetical protein